MTVEINLFHDQSSLKYRTGPGSNSLTPWSAVRHASVVTDCAKRPGINKWASAWDFQQCGILTCVDSDEPVQPPCKLRNLKRFSVSIFTLVGYSSDKQRLWSDCAYALADLRLCWSQIPHCWKSHALAQICKDHKRWQLLICISSLDVDRVVKCPAPDLNCLKLDEPYIYIKEWLIREWC